MWSPILEPGRLVLLQGKRSELRAFHQELAHRALRLGDGYVLWADADHGFNPYDFAELNLTRGQAAEWGADRLLVKRCMTPFQWDTVLTRHLDQKLSQIEANLVLAAPYDALFSTDELKDWEQEDYVRFSLGHLKELAERHRVPVVISIDMPSWWKSHPTLATMAQAATSVRWAVARRGSGWSARSLGSEWDLLARWGRQTTLEGFLERSVVPAPPITVR